MICYHRSGYKTQVVWNIETAQVHIESVKLSTDSIHMLYKSITLIIDSNNITLSLNGSFLSCPRITFTYKFVSFVSSAAMAFGFHFSKWSFQSYSNTLTEVL